MFKDHYQDPSQVSAALCDFQSVVEGQLSAEWRQTLTVAEGEA